MISGLHFTYVVAFDDEDKLTNVLDVARANLFKLMLPPLKVCCLVTILYLILISNCMFRKNSSVTIFLELPYPLQSTHATALVV